MEWRGITRFAIPLLLAFTLACAHPAHRAPAGGDDDDTPLEKINYAHFKSPAWAVVNFNELKKYDTLYAISDLHGELKKATTLLSAADLIAPKGEGFKWIGKKALLVIDGDYIDKSGHDCAGTLLLLEQLQTEAPRSGSKVIVLMGNHEAEYLGRPEKCSKEFLKSAREHTENDKLKCEDILDTPFGKYMQTLPVGAIVGSWLFAHSGYIDAEVEELPEYLEKLEKHRVKGNYAPLYDPKDSFVGAHDWTIKHHKAQHRALKALGLTGMVVGHEPRELDARGEIAMNEKGWFIKIDTGMNAEESPVVHGRLLKCPMSDILNNDETALLMMGEDDKPLCRQIDESGAELKIPRKSWPD